MADQRLFYIGYFYLKKLTWQLIIFIQCSVSCRTLSGKENLKKQTSTDQRKSFGVSFFYFIYPSFPQWRIWKYILSHVCSLMFKIGKSAFYPFWVIATFSICSAAVDILFYFTLGDFGLPSRALLSAPRGGHVGRPVAEEVQVSWDCHGHCLRAAWLLWTGERKAT